MIPVPSGGHSTDTAPLDRNLDRRRFFRPARCLDVERLASLGERRSFTGGALVAAHDHVDIERIEFEPAANAAGFLSCNEGRPGAEERVNDNVAPVRDVEQRVLKEGGWLYRRMILEASPCVGPKRRGSGISQTFERQRPRFPSSTLLICGA